MSDDGPKTDWGLYEKYKDHCEWPGEGGIQGKNSKGYVDYPYEINPKTDWNLHEKYKDHCEWPGEGGIQGKNSARYNSNIETSSEELKKQDFTKKSSNNSHLGKNSNQISKKLSEHQNDLSTPEKQAIANYTIDSTLLNNSLRKFHENKADLEDYFKPTQSHLDNATNIQIKHPHNLYRRLSFHPHSKTDKRGLLYLPGYVSTSIRRKVAENFAVNHNPEVKFKRKGDTHILRIEVKPGDKGRHIQNNSLNKDEYETLLPRQTVLKIDKEPESIDKSKNGNYNVHTWRATIHSQPPYKKPPLKNQETSEFSISSKGKNPNGGLNAEGRKEAKKQGHNLKPPVKSGDNPRRASFLARMGNMPGPEYDSDGKPTRLLLSLRAWGASSKEDARKKAAEISKRNKAKETSEEEDPCWEGYEMIGMKDKDGKKVPNCVPKKKKEESSGGVSYDVPDNYQDGIYDKDGYLKSGGEQSLQAVQRKKIGIPNLNINNNINVDGIPFALRRHKTLSAQDQEGVYVGVHYTPVSQSLMKTWLEENKIPNPIDTKDMHTTIVYSKSGIDMPWEPMVFAQPLRVINSTFSFDIFENDGKKCLVLLLSCPLLVKRWELGQKLGGDWQYPDYKPHITLSYDVGDFNLHTIKLPWFSLYISDEYCEPLKKNFSSKKSKKKSETSNFTGHIEQAIFGLKPKTAKPPVNLANHPKYLEHKAASKMHSDAAQIFKNKPGMQKYYMHHLRKFGDHEIAMHELEKRHGKPTYGQ